MIAGLIAIAGVAAFAWSFRKQLKLATSEWSADATQIRAELERLRVEGLPAPPPNGFNLNRRPDAVRRLRAGQALDAIAAATGWSVAEIALLQKVERLGN